MDRRDHLVAHGLLELVEQPHPVLRRPLAARQRLPADAVAGVDLDAARLEELAARTHQLVPLDLLEVTPG